MSSYNVRIFTELYKESKEPLYVGNAPSQMLLTPKEEDARSFRNSINAREFLIMWKDFFWLIDKKASVEILMINPYR